MNEQRDFKGVWIPKDIWLSEELTLLEKCIFIEIDSLDNEDHCTAGNEYFAQFCNCSESKVTKAIRKLQDLNMIEIMSFDGRCRKIRVVKSTRQGSKKYEAESYKVRPNNIYNNIDNKESISKDIETAKFEFGTHKQPKISLYHKCATHINEFTKNNADNTVKNLLITFLDSLVEMKKLRGERQFVGILNKLEEYGHTEDEQIKIIKNSIEHGYGTFYELNEYKKSNNKVSSDMGRTVQRASKEVKEAIRNGKGNAEKF